MQNKNLFLLCASLLVSCAEVEQPIEVANLTIDEIRILLDESIQNQFDRVTESDVVGAVLILAMHWIETKPEMKKALELTDEEIKAINTKITDWREDPNRVGDNRISKMCEVWANSSYLGADRIDEALLTYEIESSTGYSEFSKSRIESLLSNIEATLNLNSWEGFSAYVQDQVDSWSGKISHSSFSSHVRRTQDIETMKYHCGN